MEVVVREIAFLRCDKFKIWRWRGCVGWGGDALERSIHSAGKGSMSASSSEESSCSPPVAECPVTEEWVGAVLSAHHERPVQVTALTVRPGCDQGESVLSDILAVHVDYTLDHPAQLSLIVKLLPQDPFSRYFVTEAQFDLREIKFYTKVS